MVNSILAHHVANDLRTVTVRDFDAMAAHLVAWDHLACKAPQRLPTLLPAWVDAFLRHQLKSDEGWLCCFAYIGEACGCVARHCHTAPASWLHPV